MANFTALAAARRAMTPGNVREEGLAGPGRPRLTVYASDQVHACADKAVDLLGIGTSPAAQAALGRPVSDSARRARAGRRGGSRGRFTPAIVVGNAGTVNTGAIDPLDALADFCAAGSLWFHVDGAYGAMAALSPRLKPLFSGIERADSVAADPHKWLYVPYEAERRSCASPAVWPRPFAGSPSTWRPTRRAPSRAPPGLRSAASSSRAASRRSRSGWAGKRTARRDMPRPSRTTLRWRTACPRRSTDGPTSSGSRKPFSRSRTFAGGRREANCPSPSSTRSIGGSSIASSGTGPSSSRPRC